MAVTRSSLFIYWVMLGLSCVMWDLSLRFVDSPVVCGIPCSTARGVLFPRPGTEPNSSALQGGLLTSGPPGKSPNHSQ